MKYTEICEYLLVGEIREKKSSGPNRGNEEKNGRDMTNNTGHI